MKTKIFLLILLVSSIRLFGQIELEQSYTDIDRYSFTMIELEKEGYKYMEYDESSVALNLYNLDHSLYKTISFDNLPSDSTSFYLEVRNVSQNLFNLNDDIDLLFEYYYQDKNYKSYYFVKAITENNDVLLFVEDATLGFDNNMNDGQVLFNTAEGVKLHVLCSDTIAKVYSLPGELGSESNQSTLSLANDTLYINNNGYVYLGDYKQQLTVSNDTIYLSNGGFVYLGSDGSSASIKIESEDESVLNVYPTVTSDVFKVNYNISGSQNSKMLFIDTKGSVIEDRDITDKEGQYTLMTNGLSNGIYYVIILMDNGEVYNRQLIIKK